MMKTKIYSWIILVAVGCSLLEAQVTNEVSKRGTTAAPFLSIGQGARALGMGSAFVAIANDPSAMYWNPAGIADLSGIEILIDHTYWIADIQYDYLAATINTGSFGTVGVNLTMSNIGEMNVTTIDQHDGTGETFSVTDMAVGVSYGLKLTDAFAIGFNPKFIYQKIWKMSASAFAHDLGVKYNTPFKGVTLGMSVSNFGTKMQMHGTNAIVLYDPDPTSTGTNNRIPAEMSMDEWELPLNFRVGLGYDLPLGSLGKLTLAADAMHPSDNYESVNIGGEYVFDDFIYLRGGMKSLFLKDSEETSTFGIGIRKYLVGHLQFSVDYAYQSFSRLKNAQKMTLGIIF
jgi:hypothetical protein